MDKENKNKNIGENKGKNTEEKTKANTEEKRERVGIEAGSDVGLEHKLFFENRIKREWLSTEEAAFFLSVTENAIRIMVHRGQIVSYKFGRRLRFRVQDCQALFQQKGA